MLTNLTFPTHRHSLKGNLCHKKFFLLVNLFTPLLNWSHQGADIFEEKNFLHCFIHLTLNMLLIFDFKHVVREVGRKFVMEHVFCMDRDFKAQLCLWAPLCPINLTQSWYTNSGLARTPKSPHPLWEKFC